MSMTSDIRPGGQPCVYVRVFKALRYLMAATLQQAGRIDAGDAACVQACLLDVRDMLAAQQLVADWRARWIEPAVAELTLPPSAAAQTADAALLQARLRLLAACDALAHAEPDAAQALAAALYGELAGYVAACLVQLDAIEAGSGMLLRRHRPAPVLLRLEQRFYLTASLEQLLLLMPSMIPALSPAERAGMLELCSADAELADLVLMMASDFLSPRECAGLRKQWLGSRIPALA